MVLRFTVLGFELARITLDIEQGREHVYGPEEGRRFDVEHAVERGVKAVSKAWVKRMISG